MTQRELAARLNQNHDTQPQRKAAEAARRGNAPEVQCIHRDTEAAGKLKCSCSQQPVVYACSNPFVFSGYCTPTLPTQPGDGPIVRADGSKLTPADKRFPSFLPMPLRDGETPRPCDVVVCESCPHLVEPPAHIKRLRQLGIKGDYDEAGHCDILHVIPPAEHWVQHATDYLNSSPDGMASCSCPRVRVNASELIEATKCKILISHTGETEVASLITAAEAFPDVRIWCVLHGSQNSMCHNMRFASYQAEALAASQRLPNFWYGTPELTADFTRFGYERYLHWPNPMPFKQPSVAPPITDPPVLLISARDDIIKGNAVKVLAAGLVAQSRLIAVHAAIKGGGSQLHKTADVAGIKLVSQPIRTQIKFREYIHEQVAVVLSSSLTDADQYVGRDSLSQGRPVVGSQTIRYLPREWQADPNDPRDIARVAMMFLDDYPRYSEQALRLGCEIRDRQRDAYRDAIARILE